MAEPSDYRYNNINKNKLGDTVTKIKQLHVEFICFNDFFVMIMCVYSDGLSLVRYCVGHHNVCVCTAVCIGDGWVCTCIWKCNGSCV